MEALISSPFVREVVAVCVDPSPSRPPLPPWLKSVPTLIIAGESEPRVGPGPVNNWLAERRMGIVGGAAPRTPFDDRRAPLSVSPYSADAASRPEATSRVVPPVRNSVSVATAGKLPAAVSASAEGDKSASPPELAGSKDDSKVDPYHKNELRADRWSDEYSYLKGDTKIERNFEFLATGGLPGTSGGGGGSATPSSKQSEKESALLREFEAYNAARESGMPKVLMRKG
jgi:hypothetical protein